MATSATGTDSRELAIKRMAGSHAPAEESYVDLYEHNVWLRDLTRWDWGAPFLAAGTMALGGAIGAVAAGASAGSKGVLVLWVAAAATLLCGAVLRDQRSKDVRKGQEEFDRRLCLYDDEPTAKAIREQLDAQAAKQAAEHTLRAKLGRLKERVWG